MHLSYGILADAVVTTGGKWNALGIFNLIRPGSLPWKHPTAGMLLRLTGDVRDLGKHELKIHFVNQLGTPVIEPYRVGFAMQAGPDGLPLDVDVGVELKGLTIPEEGQYDFIVLVDDRYMGSIPMQVRTP